MSDGLSKLNGWQRIWVVVSVLVGIFLMLVGEKLIPTQETLAAKFDKPLGEEQRYLAELHQRQGQTDAFSRDFFPPSEIKNTEIRIQSLQGQYAQERKTLWRDQIAIRSVFIGVWIAICLGLYCIGVVVGWVIRGFRPEKSR